MKNDLFSDGGQVDMPFKIDPSPLGLSGPDGKDIPRFISVTSQNGGGLQKKS